ncbi:MAG: hypothetical protein QG567_2040 [Campylobacterota bacterium]|nr:hypothetical protein [Campylobacterota bacterium]
MCRIQIFKKGENMRKFIAMSAIAAMAVMGNASDPEVEKLKEELASLKEQVKDIKVKTAGDNVKFSVNMRTAIDAIEYTRASGAKNSNANLMTNRLQLGMAAQAAENLTFNGLLSYNKAFGAAPAGANGFPQRGYGYDTFDWVINENLTDDTLKVKEASMYYYGEIGVPFTFSVGRRPATDGFLANHREDVPSGKSPLAHSINVEYDGLSFLLKELTDFGTSFKICAGRGLTNARSRFNMDGGLTSYGDYSESDTSIDSVDMYGFILVPYDDGQYKVSTMMYTATNLPGFTMANGTVGNDFSLTGGDGMIGGLAPVWSGTGTVPTETFNGMKATSMNSNLVMKSMGDFDGQVLSFEARGLGDGISDFLDDTNFFASYARSITKPNNENDTMNLAAFDGFIGYDMNAIAQIVDPADGDPTDSATATPTQLQNMATNMANMANNMAPVKEGMLGSTDSETGSSIWVGINFPAIITDGRFGLEYNQGDEYWRSFTYGEDTMIGSKLAARGNATEVYYTQPIVGNNFVAQLRYTTITYTHTGSQGFFGSEGMPLEIDDAVAMGMDPVEKATDMRFSLTYNY